MTIGHLSRTVLCAIRQRAESPRSRFRLEGMLFAGALVAGLTWPHIAAGREAPFPTAVPKSSVDSSGYLHTDGARLVNAAGQEVRITGINWFGLETCAFTPHGLWIRNWRDLMLQIKALGFNTIRLPFSNQLLDPGTTPDPRTIDYRLNPDLKGLSGLQIMDKIVAEAKVLGLKVILDQHRPDCGAQSPLWYTDHYSEARWIADWVRLAQRYAGNDAVVGADLHNEPHGPATWGDGNPATDWRLAAERAGDAILAANPHWLIVVEGVEHIGPSDWYWWGGNLAAAGRYPVRLSVPGRLVYEAHDYGPEVSQQSWFSAPDFPNNLASLWDKHWGYLQEQGIAPVLVGEFGGQQVDSGTEGTWIHTLMNYIRTNGLSYTYWCLNPNSGDTGGILNDDWTTVNAAKMALLQTDLAPMIGTPEVVAPPPPPSPSSPAATQASSTPSLELATQPAPAPSPAATQPPSAEATQQSTENGTPITVESSVANGISTGEDDLTMDLPATIYQVGITITVKMSAPGTDPGEANPQALPGDALNGHSRAQATVNSSHLVYTFTGATIPAGHAVAAARFDFTSGRQNKNGVHPYGQDTYTVQYATAPDGPLTALEGHF